MFTMAENAVVHEGMGSIEQCNLITHCVRPFMITAIESGEGKNLSDPPTLSLEKVITILDSCRTVQFSDLCPTISKHIFLFCTLF